MVSATVKLKELVSWSISHNIIREGDDFFIYYYPDENTMVKVKIDSASMALLKQKRNQLIQNITTSLDEEVTISGTIAERWKKKVVVKREEVEDWVKET